jgi:hypothetical protein
MGIPLEQFNDSQKSLIDPRDRKAIYGIDGVGKSTFAKRRGMTAAEIRDKNCTTLERKIHDQFTGFCNRNGFIVWHSNPTRKSSIRAGLPDFLLWKCNLALGIEFKVPPNHLTAVQVAVFEEIGFTGCRVVICTETSEGAAYSAAVSEVTEFFKLQGFVIQ